LVALNGMQRIRIALLNGLERSVNRKVQGSNPWSGAKSKFELRPMLSHCLGGVATV